MSRTKLAAATIAAALLMAMLPAASASASAMSDDYAGRYYLAHMCPGNTAWQRLERVMFKGKSTVTAKQMHGKRLRQTRRALSNFQRVEYNGGRALLNPPLDWPTTDIANATKAVGLATVHDSNLAGRLRIRKGQRFINYWNNVFMPAVDDGTDKSSTARALLDLPPVGGGC